MMTTIHFEENMLIYSGLYGMIYFEMFMKWMGM